MAEETKTEVAIAKAEKRTGYFMSVDVESMGLYGDAFAIGATITSMVDGSELTCFVASCSYKTTKEYLLPLDHPRNRTKWIEENVVPHITLNIMADPLELRAYFWDFYRKQSDLGLDDVVVHTGYPVEARLFEACVNDGVDFATRQWQAPYPLQELSTLIKIMRIRLGDEFDSKTRYEERGETPVHHPLSDARHAARLWRECCKALTIPKRIFKKNSDGGIKRARSDSSTDMPPPQHKRARSDSSTDMPPPQHELMKCNDCTFIAPAMDFNTYGLCAKCESKRVALVNGFISVACVQCTRPFIKLKSSASKCCDKCVGPGFVEVMCEKCTSTCFIKPYDSTMRLCGICYTVESKSSFPPPGYASLVCEKCKSQFIKPESSKTSECALCAGHGYVQMLCSKCPTHPIETVVSNTNFHTCYIFKLCHLHSQPIV